MVAAGNQRRVVVVVLVLLDEVDDEELELELELPDGRVVEEETDGEASSSWGACVGGRGTPTSAVFDTLG